MPVQIGDQCDLVVQLTVAADFASGYSARSTAASRLPGEDLVSAAVGHFLDFGEVLQSRVVEGDLHALVRLQEVRVELAQVPNRKVLALDFRVFEFLFLGQPVRFRRFFLQIRDFLGVRQARTFSVFGVETSGCGLAPA